MRTSHSSASSLEKLHTGATTLHSRNSRWGLMNLYVFTESTASARMLLRLWQGVVVVGVVVVVVTMVMAQSGPEQTQTATARYAGTYMQQTMTFLVTNVPLAHAFTKLMI